MAHKIAVTIQKGGVGKTTTAVHVAQLLAASGFRVLIIDLDSQGNATQMITQKSIYTFTDKTVLEAMKEEDPRPYIVKGEVDLLPAEDMLVTFSRYIYTNRIKDPVRILRRTMEPIESEYDFIIMDAPPNLGDIVLNAMTYCDSYIIPVQREAFSLDALDRFVSFIDEAKELGHSEAGLLGIVFTMTGNTKVENAIGENIRSRYGDKVFQTEIKRRARLKEYALTGTEMKRKADAEALDDYINLTKEVVTRVKQK